MFCMLKKKKIYPAYVWKHGKQILANSNPGKQVILLMIQNGKRLKGKSEGNKTKSKGQ